MHWKLDGPEKEITVRSIAFVFSFAASFIAFADQDGSWVFLGGASGYKMEGKANSLRFGTTRDGKEIAIIEGRVVHPDNTITFAQWYVSASDCADGRGTIYTADVRGDLVSQSDFILGGGTNSAFIADVICGAATKQIESAPSEKPKATDIHWDDV